MASSTTPHPTLDDPCIVCGAGLSHQPEHAAWCAEQAKLNASILKSVRAPDWYQDLPSLSPR